MPPAGIELAIPAIELPQTHALDRADTGIGSSKLYAFLCVVNGSYLSVASRYILYMLLY
jgi:hypothetical protein